MAYTNKDNKRLKQAAITATLFLLLPILAACGQSEDDSLTWKLKNAESKTYTIKVIGTARVEPELFRFEREKLWQNGSPVTVSLRDEAFLIIRNKGKTALESEYVTGATSFASYPDLSTNQTALQTLNSIFQKKEGVSVGTFTIEKKGAHDPLTENGFLAMKIYLRLPNKDLLTQKNSILPRMGYSEEQLCLNLHNRKIKSHEVYNAVTLSSLSKNDKGDILADMRYTVSERIETEYREGDFARRYFLKRFNDGNLLGNRPLPEDDDDVQKTYTCQYKGRHVFNLTRGWLESIMAEHSIEVMRMVDNTPKVTEILRAKVKITPTDQKVEPTSIVENDLLLLGEIIPDDMPAKKPAPKEKTTISETPKPADVGGSNVPQIPKSMPAGNSLPDPDIDIENFDTPLP